MVNHAHVHLLPHNDDNENWNKVQTAVDQLQVEKEKPTPEKLKETQEMFKKF
jgi:diadenosine tetraphosphate (Ap4A) HIT family hydrolase